MRRSATREVDFDARFVDAVRQIAPDVVLNAPHGRGGEGGVPGEETLPVVEIVSSDDCYSYDAKYSPADRGT